MAGGRRKRMQKSVAEIVQDNYTYSELPTELMELILSKLNLKDSIRASAVCKKWLAVATSLRKPINAPWLMSFPKSGEWYQFFDPSSRRMYYAEYPELHGSRICYAKDSWLLAFKPRTRCVFFFQPYTRALIKLPKQQSALDNMAFSAAPTSSSCVLFTMKNITPTVVAIHTCRPGATAWTTLHFQNHQRFVCSVWNKVVFCMGLFYILSPNGLLGLFDPEKSMWIISLVPPPQCTEHLSVVHWRRGKFMVEHNGDIFVIYTHAKGNPLVYKLDEIQGFWQEMRILGGMTLFANSLSSAARSDVHGMMRNRVYFSKLEFYGKRCVTYYPESRRYYPRMRYYDWGQEDAFQTIWIDPPQDTSTLIQG
ncbi:hypothetical protein C2S53_013967 [Perilla frutescens var. hirtella]|uniref:F-box domain-containing protein n=1 Tax=Perilla frutescens var. hirtella TaxID=608512 RepID=A0AAD4PG83_PERFH|nr:hypothetical protein C2S53_013967 [Perilla frutescens var. hirtella]